MYIKICGITQPDQAEAIANLGCQGLGFIGVPQTPRYLAPERMIQVVGSLRVTCDRIGVFRDQDPELIKALVRQAGLTGIQLHGDETPQVCAQLRQALPGIRLIKGFRLRAAEDLQRLAAYDAVADWFLIDAYDPHQAGGTGKTADWSLLQAFCPAHPWLLAGGIRPENLAEALGAVSPDGIDLSSGVETTPGVKDLAKVRQLFEQLACFQNKSSPTSKPKTSKLETWIQS